MTGNARYATYLFDLDGTLIDSIELIMESFRHTMRMHLGAVPADDGWRAGFGTPLRGQLAEFSGDPETVSAMVATYRAYTSEHHNRLLRSYPGVDTALAALRAGGGRLGVVTSKSHALARKGLERCGLSDYFTVLVGVDDVSEPKPHPAPVRAALAQLSAAPEQAVFVGDSPHDLRAGRAAGVQTAAALWGPFGREALAAEAPDHWLVEPSSIADLAP